MSEVILEAWDGPTVPIHALSEAGCAAALEADPFLAALARTVEFKGKPNQVLLAPGADGALAKVLFGAGECAKIDWQFLGLSMPWWVAITLGIVGLWGAIANCRSKV